MVRYWLSINVPVIKVSRLSKPVLSGPNVALLRWCEAVEPNFQTGLIKKNWWIVTEYTLNPKCQTALNSRPSVDVAMKTGINSRHIGYFRNWRVYGYNINRRFIIFGTNVHYECLEGNTERIFFLHLPIVNFWFFFQSSLECRTV